MSTAEIVVLGGPNSGKTHFAGQLYGRLRRRPGELRLRQGASTPADLSALEEVLRSLEDGCAAGHTPTDTWAEVRLPLENLRGDAIDLRWPDYGGEQLASVFRERSVTKEWRSRLANADGWLLFVRLQSETTYSDSLAGLSRRPPEGGAPSARAGSWDANARLVELLQILLHVAEVGTVRRVAEPALVVLLSCYDELAEVEGTPSEVLAARMPLLSAFIESTWESDAVCVWGLSSLGRLLEKESNDDDFIDDGPEMHGWVIPPDGSDRHPDLSRPLAWLLEAR